MATVPSKHSEKVGWFKTREAGWTASAAGIGLLPGDMTTMSARIAAAEAALADQAAAQAAAKSATVTADEAVRLMGMFGADLIKKIRAKAGQVGGTSVYALADVRPPATPSPTAPPGEPYGFKVELGTTGSLTLTWKAKNPANGRGTVYQIYRRTTPDGAFTYLGGAGEKKFVDATLPAGASQVTYQIQGVRSTSVGPWAQLNVNFGVAAGGGVTASVEKASPKLAA